MTNFKVIHEKNDCISCGACAAISPEFWEMDEEGLAQLKNSKKIGENWELNLESFEDKNVNEEAAQVCPVQIIKVEEK